MAEDPAWIERLMEAWTHDAPLTTTTQGHGVGRIPLRNVWLLMLYASDLLRLDGWKSIAPEAPDDDIPQLVAKLLVWQVEPWLRRDLRVGYKSREATLSFVRGRIDVRTTLRDDLLARGRVACRYHELSRDTPRNRFVRDALLKIASVLPRTDDLRGRARGLAHVMQRAGVIGPGPSVRTIESHRFGINDQHERPVFSAAVLAHLLSIPSEVAGSALLPGADREIKLLRKLFEKAVLGFYRHHLTAAGWEVSARKLAWQASRMSSGMPDILPQMHTDITLRHPPSRRIIAIDTKFNSVLSKGKLDVLRLRSGYLYQMHAYLRSLPELRASGDPWRVAGVLLHPTIDADLAEWMELDSHRLWVRTVNLGSKQRRLQQDLLQLVEACDEGWRTIPAKDVLL